MTGFWWVSFSQHVFDCPNLCAKILGPKVIHGLLAACTDIYLVELSRRTIGPRYISTAVSPPFIPEIDLNAWHRFL